MGLRGFKLQLQAAGLASLSPTLALVAILSIATIAATFVHLSFEVFGLTVCVFLASIGGSLEWLGSRARYRADALAKLWPEVIDSLHSAAVSGIGLIDALAGIATSGPVRIRKEFAGLVQRLDSGWNLYDGLEWLKTQFGQVHADRVLELIRQVHESGGQGYIDSLRVQAIQTRSEVALWGELNSKQGWVTATAKLALIAPWFIVATLSSREENVAIYNSSEGVMVLVFGLLVSLVAYRAILLLGALSRPERVFVN